MTHINEEDLVDYLYEEGDGAERLKIARHLQDCATCSVAVLELQSVRGLLNHWTPPAAELGLKVVRDPAPASDTSGWRHWLPVSRVPVWQAAAGALLFAMGVGFSQLHLEYGDGALIVRSRSMPATTSASRRDIVLAAEPITAALSPSVTGQGLGFSDGAVRPELVRSDSNAQNSD